MPLLSFQHLAAYDAWANRRLAAVLLDEHPRAIRLLAHAATAELTWLRRIAGTQPTSQTLDFWPDTDAEGCRSLVEDAAAAMHAFLDRLDDAGLVQVAVYRNSKGIEYRTPVPEVLTHVFFHSHYHRGQAATALREAGVDPLWTDYIAWVRAQGH